MLYRPKVDNPTETEPDLATTGPQISADGCRVTVMLKPSVRFSPPVSREVTSADVKYAVERGFFAPVNNGYAGVYFGDLRGAKVGAEPGTRIPESRPPMTARSRSSSSANTARRCAGGVLAAALSMPLSAPVPQRSRSGSTLSRRRRTAPTRSLPVRT
jgi:peptide/nickel transport system substrate-binding protein